MNVKKGYIVYPGDESYSLGNEIKTLPLQQFLVNRQIF